MGSASNDKYPSDWNSRRAKVFRRDAFECVNCGEKGGPKGDAELHAHHIVPIKDGGTHKLSNLKTLCNDCHKAIHTNSKAPTSREFSNNRSNDKFSVPFKSCPLCHLDNSLKVHRKKPRIYCPNCNLVLRRRRGGNGNTWIVENHWKEGIIGAEFPEQYWRTWSKSGPIPPSDVINKANNKRKPQQEGNENLISFTGLFSLFGVIIGSLLVFYHPPSSFINFAGVLLFLIGIISYFAN